MRASTFSRRLLACVVAVLAAAAATASQGLADGDPCSDVLVNVDVCIPVAPTAPPFSTLVQRVRELNRGGYRVKVAVIAAKEDLGSIPSLFGHPADYASFLGQELQLVYHGNLMILMPAGIGFYHAGRAVAKEDAVLSQVHVAAGTAGLAATAANAVDAVAAAVGPPIATARAASVGGSRVWFSFGVVARPTAPKVVVRASVRLPTRLVASKSLVFRQASAAGRTPIRFDLPRTAPRRGLRACVQAVVGTRASVVSCTPVRAK